MTNTTNPIIFTPADLCPTGCDTRDAARLPGDTIASIWECDACGTAYPFTEEDYRFANTSRWTARRTFGPRP